MNASYKIFTDKLLHALQNAQEYVGIQEYTKDNIFYEIEYIDDEDDYYNHRNAYKSSVHKDFQVICEKVLYALENNTPMPYICINNCEAKNLLTDSSELLKSFFTDIKSEGDRDLIYENIFNGFGEKYIAQCLISFKDNNKLQETALLYLLKKCIKPDSNLEVYSHAYGNFIEILTEKIVVNSITRDIILTGLDSYYPRFLKYDKEKEGSYYSSDSPRKAIDSYLERNEDPVYWHLYHKYTTNGKELANFQSSGSIFKDNPPTIESFNISHNELLLLYPHILHASDLTKMIDDVMKHTSLYSVEGFDSYGLLPRKNYNMQTSSYPHSTVWVQVCHEHDKEHVLPRVKKILTKMFDFYQANINPKQPEYEKEKLVKQVLPTFILDSKIPEKIDVTPIKKKKI